MASFNKVILAGHLTRGRRGQAWRERQGRKLYGTAMRASRREDGRGAGRRGHFTRRKRKSRRMDLV